MTCGSFRELPMASQNGCFPSHWPAVADGAPIPAIHTVKGLRLSRPPHWLPLTIPAPMECLSPGPTRAPERARGTRQGCCWGAACNVPLMFRGLCGGSVRLIATARSGSIRIVSWIPRQRLMDSALLEVMADPALTRAQPTGPPMCSKVQHNEASRASAPRRSWGWCW